MGRVGEESGRVEWEGRVGEWDSGEVEGRGREEEERKGRMMGMGRDEDGMVYVYMIVQMSMNIRDSQTRKSESFLREKKSSCDKKKAGKRSVTRLLSAHFVNIRHRNKQVLGTGTLHSAAAFLIISFSHRCWPHLTTQDRILFKSARDV